MRLPSVWRNGTRILDIESKYSSMEINVAHYWGTINKDNAWEKTIADKTPESGLLIFDKSEWDKIRELL